MPKNPKFSEFSKFSKLFAEVKKSKVSNFVIDFLSSLLRFESFLIGFLKITCFYFFFSWWWWWWSLVFFSLLLYVSCY